MKLNEPNTYRSSDPLGYWTEVAIFIAIMPCFAMFYLVLLPVILRDIWRTRRFRHRLRQANRLLDWQATKGRLTSGKGTLFVAVTPKGLGAEAWWSEADLNEIHPDCPLPSLPSVGTTAESYAHIYKCLSLPATLEWCKSFLPLLATQAYLTDLPKQMRRERMHGLPADQVRFVFWTEMERFRKSWQVG
jgi:hypothetical protein